MNKTLALLLIPLLAACSSARTSVVPLKVLASEYQSWTCQQLADEQMRLSIAMTVDVSEDEVDRAKHRVQNIVATMGSKKCSGPKPIIAAVS